MHILDENPEVAVKSLTKKDILRSYVRMYKHFYALYNDSELFEKNIIGFGTPLVSPKTTLSNQKTFMFYWDFFINLEKCVNEIYGRKEYIERTFTEKDFKKHISKLPNINKVNYVLGKVHKNKEYFKWGMRSANNTIACNRLDYILNEYSYKEFYYGIPTWYSVINPIISEKYSLKEHKFLRIEQVKGKYKYYISNYRYDWEEIKGIPDIVQSIIDTILFV